MGKFRRILMMMGLMLALPATALAASSSELQNIVLNKGEHWTGNYYAAGQTVTVDGDVDGDVICAGQTVVINGAVGGDVLCAGQAVTVNGKVGGSVRSLGQTVTINGAVGRGVTAGAQNFRLGQDGAVSGEAAIGAQTLTLSGSVARTAYLVSQEMNLKSTIGGDLNYTSEKTPVLDKSKVSGKVVSHAWPSRAQAQPTAAEKLAMLLYWMAAALAGAAIMIWLAPRLVRSVADEMSLRWQASLGWGFLALIVTPGLCVLLLLTVIGVPAAAVIFMLWLLALTVSGLLVGIAGGRLIRADNTDSRPALLNAASIGVPIFVAVHWLPIIGPLVGFVGAAWALGGLLLAANRARS